MKISENLVRISRVSLNPTPTPPFPKSMKLEITSRCNSFCSYCANPKNLWAKGDIKREFALQVINEAASLGVEEMGFFIQGESLLVPDLPEYVRHAVNRGIKYTFVTTNGQTDKNSLKNLIDAGLGGLKFSINAPNKEHYKKLCGIDGFDLALENVKWVQEYKIKNNMNLKTAVSCIYDPKYSKELKEFRLTTAPHTDDFYFLPLYNHTGIVGESKTPPYLPCWNVYNMAYVSYDGWLLMCSFSRTEPFKVVKVSEGGLLAAWHHPKMQEIRSKHMVGIYKGTPCENCSGEFTGFPK